MEKLLEELEKKSVEAMRACAITKPSGGDVTPEYQWGYLQGKYAAWRVATQVVAAFIEDQHNEFDEDEEQVGAS